MLKSVRMVQKLKNDKNRDDSLLFQTAQLFPAKSHEIPRKFSSRSSKVIDLGANRKHIFNFLLVIYSRPNFGRPVSYRFRDRVPVDPPQGLFRLAYGAC